MNIVTLTARQVMQRKTLSPTTPHEQVLDKVWRWSFSGCPLAVQQV